VGKKDPGATVSLAAGCSVLTGIEAIADGVPAFRRPRARLAQRTELMLGAILTATATVVFVATKFMFGTWWWSWPCPR
jgi:hypothetical protein